MLQHFQGNLDRTEHCPVINPLNGIKRDDLPECMTGPRDQARHPRGPWLRWAQTHDSVLIGESIAARSTAPRRRGRGEQWLSTKEEL
jgi:hypothetical protein